MFLLIILIIILLGALFLRAFLSIHGPKSKEKNSFKEGFNITDSIISISVKGRIENVLYVDKAQELALFCNQIKKKTNILKEFNLGDIKELSPFEETSLDENDSDNIYVKTFGLKIALKDETLITLYYMNDTTYVIKPNFVYETTYKLRDENISLLKKRKRNAS